MLLLFWIVSRARGARRHALGAVLTAITIITAASFIWSLWETSTSTTWAYFSTLSRAWELGVGALIAVGAAAFVTMPSWLRTAAAWVGLAGISFSLFTISDSSGGFPAPWAALPVLATGLVIVSGIGAEARYIWPIANPVSSYIGDISYSLYLWHFPLIIFLAPLFPGEDWLYYIVTLTLIFGVSIVSYHFIEDKIRTSSLWEPRTNARKKPLRQRPHPAIAQGSGILALVLIVGGLVTWSLAGPQRPPPLP